MLAINRSVAFILDTSGTIVAANSLSDGALRSGMALSDVLGRKWWSWHSPSHQRKIRQNLAKCVQEDETVEFTLRSDTRGQVEHWHMRLTLGELTGDAAVLAVATPVNARGNPIRPVKLTKPQAALLRLLANDASLSEMASHLRLTPNAVNQRLKRLRARFGVEHNYGLVAAAGRHGLLT